MAGPYNLAEMLRYLSAKTVKRYLGGNEVFSAFEFDWAARSKGKRADNLRLFDALMGLPDATRQALESDFRQIYGLGNAAGNTAIREAIRHTELASAHERIMGLAELLNDCERATVVFMDHPAAWKRALRYCSADGQKNWRKRKNIPKRDVRTDAESLQALEQGLAQRFSRMEGRGKHCNIEYLRRGSTPEKDYFFAVLSDYSKTSQEWQEAQLKVHHHLPVFDVVFAYCKEEGTLDLKVPPGGKDVQDLQLLFAQAVLGLDRLLEVQKDNQVYDLEALAKEDFVLMPGTNGPVGQLAVCKLRYSARNGSGSKVTLEAAPGKDGKGVHRLKDALLKMGTLQDFAVSQVELVVMPLPGAERQTNERVLLTWPNMCTVKHNERGSEVRAALVELGIELREPEAGAGGPE